MKNLLFIALSLVIVMTSCKNQEEKGLEYPVTAKVDTVDTYFGVDVPDPYRWLEDDNAPETESWVKAQNEVTFAYLEEIPYRDQIKGRLTELWNYPKQGTPFKKGDNYFFFKNDGIQNQDVLYIMSSLDAEPEVLLDPNTLSEDGTVALSDLEISRDGKYLAYSIASGGSDWNEIHLMDIETREKLDDLIQWVKFSGISWEGEGFYYSRYPEPVEGSELTGKNEFHKVYYHKVGTAQDEDRLVYENSEYPQRLYGISLTEDEEHMILYEHESSTGNAFYYKKADDKEADFTPVVTNFDNINYVIDNIGEELVVMTDIDAPRKRVVLVDPANPSKENWKDFIPEKEEVLQGVKVLGNKIFASYMKDATSRVYIYGLDGSYEKELELPGLGSLGSLNGQRDSDEVFYSFTSFTFPSSIYRYDVSTGETELYRESEINFDPSGYETKQVFFKSKDGTKIPMFIVHKKGLQMDGSNPTMLYGYGGFNVSLTPSFSVSRLILLENGGVFAMPNLRGGGEYGEEWHKAGTKLQKQNVFDDFIAAAEYLIAEGYTKPEKLAMHGGSNGGLLVGAVMTQRPELFEVALPAVGVMDMLRFHKFTIGWAWTGDYGSSDNEEEFHYLLGYSPLHNLKPETCYPATLVTTADHDDRVVPAHSFKFIATLQEMQSCANPTLIRIETKAGHGAGKPTAKRIEEATDLYAFMMFNLGMSL